MEATVTDNGISVYAPERTDEFMAAGTAAVLMAENIEGRYGEDADLARMLRTANAFANDVVKYTVALDGMSDEEKEEAEASHMARGQFADVVLLGMAAGWHARVLEREHNKGPDPEQYHEAAEAMVDVWDTLFRQMAINAIGGRLDEIEYRYGKHHQEGP